MKKRLGFSLMEIMISVFIIATLSTLAVVSFKRTRSQSNDTVRLSNISQLQTALELYKREVGGYPTKTIDVQPGKPLKTPSGQILMAQVPVDKDYPGLPIYTPYPVISAGEGMGTSYSLQYKVASTLESISNNGTCYANPGNICCTSINVDGACHKNTGSSSNTCTRDSDCSGSDPCKKYFCGTIDKKCGSACDSSKVCASGPCCHKKDLTTFCSDHNAECGTVSDTECGVPRTENCGDCGGGTCNAGVCENKAPVVLPTCDSAAECDSSVCGDCSTVAKECQDFIDNGKADDTITSSSCYSPGGDTYHGIKIGKQCWLDRNINIGEVIEAKGDSMATLNASDGIKKYCWQGDDANPTSYGKDDVRCKTDGGLYTWSMAMYLPAQCSNKVFKGYSGSGERAQRKGICPQGFHVPSDYEYAVLEEYLDAQTFSPTPDPSMAEKCSTSNWGYFADINAGSTWYCKDTDSNYNGSFCLTDDKISGCGGRMMCAKYDDVGQTWQDCGNSEFKMPLSGQWAGLFVGRSQTAYSWTSTQAGQGWVWVDYFHYYKTRLYRSISNSKVNGFSLRCIKDLK